MFWIPTMQVPLVQARPASTVRYLVSCPILFRGLPPRIAGPKGPCPWTPPTVSVACVGGPESKAPSPAISPSPVVSPEGWPTPLLGKTLSLPRNTEPKAEVKEAEERQGPPVLHTFRYRRLVISHVSWGRGCSGAGGISIHTRDPRLTITHAHSSSNWYSYFQAEHSFQNNTITPLALHRDCFSGFHLGFKQHI